MGSGRRAWVAVAACWLAVLVGCGTGDAPAGDAPVVEGQGLAGVEVSIATAATLARGPQGVVLVDGLAGADDERTTRVHLDDGAGRRVLEVPGLPLNAVEAWFAGARLIVTGIDCPRFDRAALLADSGGGDVEGICGATTRRIVAVDLETGEWELLDEQPVASRDDPRLPAAADGRVVLGPGRLWDPQEGRIALTGLEALGPEREVTICSAGEAPRAVVRTGGATASGAAQLHVLVGTEWRADPLDVTAGFAGQAPLGCSTDGMVVGGHDDHADEVVARVVTTDAQGETVLAALDLPVPRGPRVPWVSVDVAGTILVDSGDGHWTAIDGERRADLGPADLMDARQVLVDGDRSLVIPNVLDRPVAVTEG